MKPIPCPECEDELTCPHSDLWRELRWRQFEDGSIDLAFMELVTLLREAGPRLRATYPVPRTANEICDRIDAALARWKHLPNFDFS